MTPFPATVDTVGMIAPQRRTVAVRFAPGSPHPRRRRRTCWRHAAGAGLAHHAVAVAVAHERIRRMVARYRSDPVRSSFRATDAAVPVVVPRGDLAGNAGCGGGGRNLATRERDQLRRRASCQYLVQRVRLASVNGQPVALPDDDHPGREPATVLRRQPLGSIAIDFVVAIHLPTRQCEVQQVGREAAPGRKVRGARTAVVRLGTRSLAGPSKEAVLPNAGAGEDVVRRTTMPASFQSPPSWMASGQLRVVRGNVLLGSRPWPKVGADPDHRPGRALQADDADDIAQGVASVRFKHGVRPAVEVALEFLLLAGHRQSIDSGCDRPGHRRRAQTIVVDSKWFDSGRSRPLPQRFFLSRGRAGTAPSGRVLHP